MKISSSFVCQECGYESPQWLGKCPECGVWNSLKEFQISNVKYPISNSSKINKIDIKPKSLSDVGSSDKLEKRILTGFSEMDGVLGGGLVKGSVTLLAGDPGVGKSTLLLQVALKISDRMPHVASDAHRAFSKKESLPRSLNEVRQSSSTRKKEGFESAFSSLASGHTILPTVLYISGEESEEQIKIRAKRIVESQKGLKNFFLLSTTNVEKAISIIEETKPSFVIIDSIQTMESESLPGLAGSVAQIRFATFSLIKLAKTFNIPIILVGHVTKEGMVAGPMILTHMVDTVLFLEGEKTTGTRILRSFKNRFGPVDEVGIFAIEEKGLMELKDPEALFLSKKDLDIPGSVLTVTMEGTRAFLVEIQALVVFSKMPIPRRVVSGVERGRVELLLAVLQKHCRVPLDTMDVFVNVAGGLRLSDRASDLSICLSIFSSFKNKSLGKTVGISEIGLLGELRNVPLLEKRVKEAKKLGFKKIITPKDYSNIAQVTGSFR